MIEIWKYHIEKMAFSLFSFLGDRMGIESRRIRMSFIYLSFITIMSPVLISALIIEFWQRVKRLNRGSRRMWDL